MTEEEWLKTAHAQWMVWHLCNSGNRTRTKAGKRKFRLFAVACCRLLWPQLDDERSRTAVEVTERHADGQATMAELNEAFEAARQVASTGSRGPDLPKADRRTAISLASECAHKTASEAALYMTCMEIPLGGVSVGDLKGDELIRALVREVFGNVVNPSVADPLWLRWNDRTIPRIAQKIYDDRAWERLGVLADALEDAGCSDAAILSHCREPGHHVRGCWLIDLFLGKQ